MLNPRVSRRSAPALLDDLSSVQWHSLVIGYLPVIGMFAVFVVAGLNWLLWLHVWLLSTTVFLFVSVNLGVNGLTGADLK